MPIAGTKRVAVIVCANGLGHFVRTLHIVSALLAREPAVHVTIMCADWQRAWLDGWPAMRPITVHPRAAFKAVALYPRWSTQSAYFDDPELLTWHHSLAALQLDSYDLVVSDNLVETLLYHPRALLVGSFLWHDVYVAHRPDSVVARTYWTECTRLLADRAPVMVASRYFAMPAVRRQTRWVGVGVLPPVVRSSRSNRSTDQRPRRSQLRGRLNVLLVGSDKSPVRPWLQGMLARLGERKAVPPGMQVYVDARLVDGAVAPPGATLFQYDSDDFSEIDAVVARPGMGTISDCLATATPLFSLAEPNPEMEHNAGVLEALGIGLRLQNPMDAFERIHEFMTDGAARARFDRAMLEIDTRGLEQAVDAITAELKRTATYPPAAPIGATVVH